jgi:hypothetical protein
MSINRTPPPSSSRSSVGCRASARDRPARRAARVVIALSLLSVGFLGAAQAARAGDPASSQAPIGGATEVAPPTVAPVASSAATDQVATGAAIAHDLEQANSIGSTSENGGGSGTSSQLNAAGAAASAGNHATTTQGAGPPGQGAAGAADAATDQVAAAVAGATGVQQSNVVVIVRINSPGDDVVSQTNVVNVVATSRNTATTGQKAPASPVRDRSSGAQTPASGAPPQAARSAEQPAVPASAAAAEHAQPSGAPSAAATTAAVQLQRTARAAAGARTGTASAAKPRSPVTAAKARPLSTETIGAEAGMTMAPDAASAPPAMRAGDAHQPSKRPLRTPGARSGKAASGTASTLVASRPHRLAPVVGSDAASTLSLVAVGSLFAGLLIGVLAWLTFGTSGLHSRLRI